MVSSRRVLSLETSSPDPTISGPRGSMMTEVPNIVADRRRIPDDRRRTDVLMVHLSGGYP